jgi:glycosyltransferase involved in cell wall biosynthesis
MVVLKSKPSVSVVIPAYNEQNTISAVVRDVLALPCVLEVIIVDDCSTDNTFQIASEIASQCSRVTVLRQAVNGGKTKALKAGFAQTKGDIVLVQDADREYDPSEIPALVEPIQMGLADVVFGSRFLVRRAARVLYFYHFLANKALTFLSNALTNINLTDVETGYKAFRGDIIRNMVISSDGFGFEIEVTAKVASLGVPIYEVPISYHGRTYEQGKKIGLKDGIAALWYILRFNLFCSVQSSFRQIPAGCSLRDASWSQAAPQE